MMSSVILAASVSVQQQHKNLFFFGFFISCSALMAALITLFFIFMIQLDFSLTVEDSYANREVKVKSGEDAILLCYGRRPAAISKIVWSKPGLGLHDYVFFFRENRPYEHLQHPTFRGRVELRDAEMKRGDASVILKNVTVTDTGTYKCVVSFHNRRSNMRFAVSTCFIKLTVTGSDLTAGTTEEGGHNERGHKEGQHKEGGHNERGDEDGNTNTTLVLTVVFTVVVGLLVLVISIVIFVMKTKCKREKSYKHPAYTEAEPQKSLRHLNS